MAVVTGGAGAIGGAIVRALQASGHRTVVIDRDGTISADLGSRVVHPAGCRDGPRAVRAG